MKARNISFTFMARNMRATTYRKLQPSVQRAKTPSFYKAPKYERHPYEFSEWCWNRAAGVYATEEPDNSVGEPTGGKPHCN